MTGYNTILKIRRIEAECKKLGMRFAYSKYGSSNGEDILSVLPTDDSLPIYSRDAELFVGTLENLEVWLCGVQWMHEYYRMIKLVDEKKIKKKEDEIRHEQLVRKLKGIEKEEENVPV